ncbi:MAG: hypothetical protein M1504_02405 [Candidatus Marsarchaeota archaeon]|nr:hypothetical protein [Candidatus Marsarchaeota archaeon]
MIKKIVYIGVILIVAAAVVLLISGASAGGVVSGLKNLTKMQNFTVNGGAFAYLPLQSVNSSLLAVGVLNHKVNVYLLNSTAFPLWENSVSNTLAPGGGNGLYSALQLEGKGAFLIYENATNVTIPANLQLGNFSASPALYALNESLYKNGMYYVVVDNTHGSASYSNQVIANFLYLLPPTNSTSAATIYNFNSTLGTLFILGVVFIVLLVAGIIVIAYGLLKKRQPTAETPTVKGGPTKEEVDRLYRGVGKPAAGRRARKKRRRQSHK